MESGSHSSGTPGPWMDLTEAITKVEAEWAPETGFFWNLRQGNFKSAAMRRALDAIASIPTPTERQIPTRLVSVLWYIPMFMEWQADRVRECGANVANYQIATSKFTREVERILGVP